MIRKKDRRQNRLHRRHKSILRFRKDNRETQNLTSSNSNRPVRVGSFNKGMGRSSLLATFDLLVDQNVDDELTASDNDMWPADRCL